MSNLRQPSEELVGLSEWWVEADRVLSRRARGISPVPKSPWLPVMSGAPWTDEEDRLVLDQKLRTVDVARRLKRSVYAIYDRRLALRKAGRVAP